MTLALADRVTALISGHLMRWFGASYWFGVVDHQEVVFSGIAKGLFGYFIYEDVAFMSWNNDILTWIPGAHHFDARRER